MFCKKLTQFINAPEADAPLISERTVASSSFGGNHVQEIAIKNRPRSWPRAVRLFSVGGV